MAFNYPFAKRENHQDIYHTLKIPDPYRWLENPDSKETKQFIDAQNAITMPYVNEFPYKEAISGSLIKLWNFPKISPPTKHGDKYYQYRNTGLQNQNVIYQMDTLKSEGRIFFDPNLLSEDGTITLANSVFSEDGKMLAYTLSNCGSDWMEVRFKNTDTGDDYRDVLKRVKFSNLCWLPDNSGIFYGAYLDRSSCETDCNKKHKLYYHRLGKDQSKDIIVAECKDPHIILDGIVSYCGKYLIVTVNKNCTGNRIYLAYLNGRKIREKFDLKPIISTDQGGFKYVTNTGNKFLFLTNRNAPNYRLVYIDIANPHESLWTTLIPEDYRYVLYDCTAVNNDKLFLCYIKDVKHTLQLHKLETGQKIMDFALDIGSINGVSCKRYHNEMFFSFASFLTPHSIYKVQFKHQKVKMKLLHKTLIEGYDSSQYKIKQVFYKSKDKTVISMFIVCKKDFVLDGTSPCLLYGYGGFNVIVNPFFSVFKIAFIKHFNGCFAVANVRGGGEYGERWHLAGRFNYKQNSFDDFQFAARYLIKKNYTNSNKLTILGASNGGLMVAACINQAPQLFSTAICQVGVLDMLRFHKFTIGYTWTSDYGSPDNPYQFYYIYKYSPLHNVKEPKGKVQYPATLLLTADHDDRVVPLHSLKFIAELQFKIGRLSKQKRPLMLRVEKDSGHGLGKTTIKLIEESTDILCFIAKSSNLKFYK